MFTTCFVGFPLIKTLKMKTLNFSLQPFISGMNLLKDYKPSVRGKYNNYVNLQIQLFVHISNKEHPKCLYENFLSNPTSKMRIATSDRFETFFTCSRVVCYFFKNLKRINKK